MTAHARSPRRVEFDANGRVVHPQEALNRGLLQIGFELQRERLEDSVCGRAHRQLTQVEQRALALVEAEQARC